MGAGGVEEISLVVQADKGSTAPAIACGLGLNVLRSAIKAWDRSGDRQYLELLAAQHWSWETGHRAAL